MPRRTKHALTAEVFEAAGRYMLTQEEVGALHNVSGERVCQILKENPAFREAYERGMAGCKAGLRKKAIEMAMAGNVTAIIWATKNVLGWADKNETKSERTVNVKTRYVAEWGRRPDELGDAFIERRQISDGDIIDGEVADDD